ncbi:Zn-ribbon domain-containing OB-fold protein [Hydrogenophaga palleronii]|uniref:Zn-ribbon domain-containing OB-fold protein n=1 Tax=Hydrogenophaga palleronii TaxID=65655 RepID=UPI000826D007|nr:zinc ribbon domain-containing protein [Hydrogenophaga palleronii]
MNTTDIFEVDLQDVYNYRFSYGGQSSYFWGLEQGRLVGSKCTGCGFVWLPLRPLCSKCYAQADTLELGTTGEILSALVLTQAPDNLAHIGMPVASALIRVDGADTCIKSMVFSRDANFAKGTRVQAHFRSPVKTIADFHFVTL